MKYLLVLMLGGLPGGNSVTQLGPFSDLLSCEKAAGQALAVARQFGYTQFGTACLAVNNYVFHYKEPKGVK